MDKKRKHNRLAAAGIATAFVIAFAAPASAADQVQTVDATIAETLTFALGTGNVTGWALATNGSSTKAAGTATVEGNALTYTMTVVGEKASLTPWDPTANAGAGGYVTGRAALAAPMSVTATKTGDTLPTGAAVVGTTAAPLIPVGTSLLGSKSYNLEFSQATTLADPALPSGLTYHNKLTYTVTSAI